MYKTEIPVDLWATISSFFADVKDIATIFSLSKSIQTSLISYYNHPQRFTPIYAHLYPTEDNDTTFWPRSISKKDDPTIIPVSFFFAQFLGAFKRNKIQFPLENPKKIFDCVAELNTLPNWSTLMELLLSDVRFTSVPKQAYQYAVAKDMTKLVTMMIERKVIDPACTCNYALVTASAHGNAEIVKLLLAIEKVYSGVHSNCPIRYAAANGHYEVVKLLMENRNTDASDLDSAALKSAIKGGYKDIAQLLVSDKKVSKGDMASFMKLAEKEGHPEIAEVLTVKRRRK
jgi:hypothetical protein